MADNQTVISSQNQKIKQLESQLNMYKHIMINKNSQLNVDTQRNSRMVAQRMRASNFSQNNNYSIQALTQQNNKLTMKLSEKKKQYEKLYQKYYRLQVENNNLETAVGELQKERRFLSDKLKDIQIHTEGEEVVGQLENKLVLMSTQIIRLGNLSKSKTQQYNQLSLRVRQLEQMNRLLQNQVTERGQIAQNYKCKIMALQQSMHNSTHNNSKYENQQTYRILSDEIQRLNTNLHNSLQDKRYLQIKVNSLQKDNERLYNREREVQSRVHTSEKDRKVQELQWDIQQLRRTNTNLKRQIEQVEQGMRKYKRQYDSNQSKIQQWKWKYSKAQEQLQQSRNMGEKRHTFEIREKEKEIQEHITNIRRYEENTSQYRHKISTLTSNYEKELQNNKNLRKGFEEQIYKYQLDYKQMKDRISSYQSQLYKYEEKIVLLSQEVQRLTSLSQDNMYTVSQLNNKLQNKEREIRETDNLIREKDHQLKIQMRDKEHVIAQLNTEKTQNERVRTQLRETANHNRQLQNQLFQQRSMKDELQVIRESLQVKTHEYKQLQKRYNEQSLTHTNNYHKSIEELQHKIVQLNTNNRHREQDLSVQYENKINMINENNNILQQKLKKVLSQYNQTQDNYIVLADQIQRLNEIIANCNSQIIKCRSTIKLQEENLTTAEKSLTKMKECYIPSQKLQEEIKIRLQPYDKQVKSLTNENNHLKIKYNEVHTINEFIEKQHRELKAQRDALQRKLSNTEQQLRERINSFTNFKENEANLVKYISQIKMGSERVQKRMEQIEEDYIQRLSQKDKDIHNYQQQIHSVQKEYRQLQTQNNDKKYEIMRLNNKVQIVQKQLVQLTQQVKGKKREIKDLEREQAAREKQFQTSFQDIKNVQVNKYTTKIQILQEELRNTYGSIDKLNEDKKQQKIIINDLGEELQVIRKEYQSDIRVTKMDNYAQTQTISYGSPINSINSSYNNNNYEQQKSIEIKQKYQILQSIHLRVKKEAQSLQQRVRQYQFKMKKLKGQFDLINRLTHEYKDQNEYLRKNNHSQCVFVGTTLQNQAISNPSHQQNKSSMEQQLIKETLNAQIQRLEVLNDGLRVQVQELRVFMTDNTALKQRLSENLCMMVLLMAQVQALRISKPHQ